MITLGDFFKTSRNPIFDGDTNEQIDYEIVQKNPDAEVTSFWIIDAYKNDGRFYVRYNKEPKNEE